MEKEEVTFKTTAFEGPLDLLLHLISKNKVSIMDIPIVEITDQYFSYINEWEQENIEFSSEFIVMASTLLYIKSKMLLPRHEEGEEGGGRPPRGPGPAAFGISKI